MMDFRLLPDLAFDADKHCVVFQAVCRDRIMQCLIAEEALRDYFWAPADAAPEDLFRVFESGRPRIESVARRLLLRGDPEPVRLTSEHFALGR